MTYYTTHSAPKNNIITANLPKNPLPEIARQCAGVSPEVAIAAMVKLASTESKLAMSVNKSRQSSGMKETQRRQVEEKRLDRLDRVLKFLSPTKGKTRGQVAKEMGEKPETVSVWLLEAIRAGAIEPRGNHMNRTYVVAQ